jgi:hypothetical protein
MSLLLSKFILMFSLWPIHSGDGCDVSGELYFYMGDDTMIGISDASCEAAKHDWTTMHVDPLRMSRI